MKYHRNCHKNLTNKADLEAAKKRYDRGKTSGRLSDIAQKKVGRRPSTPTPEMPSSSTGSPITRRKSAASHKKELCAFCQEDKKGYVVHEVMSGNVGVRIKKVAEIQQIRL